MLGLPYSKVLVVMQIDLEHNTADETCLGDNREKHQNVKTMFGRTFSFVNSETSENIIIALETAPIITETYVVGFPCAYTFFALHKIIMFNFHLQRNYIYVKHLWHQIQIGM